MNRCEDYQELISRMLDEPLTAEESANLARHRESCADCAALYAAFSALSQQITDSLEEAPDGLRENVMAEIRRTEIHKKNQMPVVLRVVLTAAACAAVIFGVYQGASLRPMNLAASVSDMSEAEVEEVYSVEAAAGSAKVSGRALNEAKIAAPESAEEVVAEEAPELYQADDADGLTAAPMLELAEDIQPQDLSSWMDRSLLRQLLGGDKVELFPEELVDSFYDALLVQEGDGSCTVLLYVRDEQLYYLDPVENAVYLAEQSPAEWEQFLQR